MTEGRAGRRPMKELLSRPLHPHGHLANHLVFICVHHLQENASLTHDAGKNFPLNQLHEVPRGHGMTLFAQQSRAPE